VAETVSELVKCGYSYGAAKKDSKQPPETVCKFLTLDTIWLILELIFYPDSLLLPQLVGVLRVRAFTVPFLNAPEQTLKEIITLLVSGASLKLYPGCFTI
jgi:hypothetical protein